jgi:genome maintenance exonuclease 1
MHTHLESHIQNLPRPPGTNYIRQLATNMSDQIINRGLVHIDEVWGMEAPLYYPNLYAGTADLIGIYKGKPAIMDYKTTNKMKTRDMIEDYSLQLAAYAMAHNELFETTIQKGVIFMVSRGLEFKEFVFEGDELEGCKERWITRLERFLSQRRLLAPALA